jgi:glycerophosphoryl diester phosphodiesterase
VAHRAGNSLTKLESAFDAGVEYVEADVWWRRGRVEVRHDRSSGPIPLLWDRWSLRPDRGTLKLHEVLAAAKGQGKVFLDLKGSSVELADAIVREASKLDAQATVAASGNWPHLDRLADILPDAPLFYSVGSVGRLSELMPRLERRTVPGVSIDSAVLDASVVEKLRRHGVRTIVTWHVDTLEHAQAVLELGVDGITSSNIEMLALLRNGQPEKKSA